MVDTIKPIKKENVKVPKLTSNGEGTTERDSRWWVMKDEDNLARGAWLTAIDILLLQQARQMDFWNYARMYGVKGLGYSNTSISTGPSALSKTQLDVRLKLNAAKCCVEAATSKIAKNEPRPMFLTTGGDWIQKKRAEGLTQYLDGAFDQADTYDIALKVFRDACIFGTGVMHVYIDPVAGEVRNEQCWIEEMIIDDAEGQYEKPRQMHRSRLVHREVLMARYGVEDPKIQDMINNAASSVYSAASTKDMIQVTESWHLRSAPGCDDGWHTVSIAEGKLYCQKYEKDYFPFVFFRWQHGLRNFFGQGIIEQVFNTQLEINMVCQTIQESIWFTAVPRVFLRNDSKTVVQHLSNKIGSVVKYSGNAKPEFATATANNPEMYNYLEYLWKKCFEQVGLSEQTATSMKPAGLNAAVAMREYQDIETQRFATVAQEWEQFFIELAQIFVDLSKDLFTGTTEFDANPKLHVKARKGKFIESIKWKDVNLPDDEYYLRCFPTSMLPTQPAGRLQFVQELIQAGMIDKDMGMDLLDYPDLDRVLSLRNAAADNAMQTLERIVDEGEYDTPEPYQNLGLCIELGQGMYLKSRNNGVPEDRLELLRRFIDDCNDLNNNLQAAQQAQQQGIPAPGTIPPTAPPQGAPAPQAGPVPQVPPNVTPIAAPIKTPRSDLVPLATT